MVIFINAYRLHVYVFLFSIWLFLHLLIYFDLPFVYFYEIFDYTIVPSFASVRSQYHNQAILQLIQ